MINYTILLIWEGVDLYFECQAEDLEHAIEQAENAYPGMEFVDYF